MGERFGKGGGGEVRGSSEECSLVSTVDLGRPGLRMVGLMGLGGASELLASGLLLLEAEGFSGWGRGGECGAPGRDGGIGGGGCDGGGVEFDFAAAECAGRLGMAGEEKNGEWETVSAHDVIWHHWEMMDQKLNM